MNRNVLIKQIVNECCIDIFGRFDEALFSVFDDNVQRFLLNIGHLESFTNDMNDIVLRQHISSREEC